MSMERESNRRKPKIKQEIQNFIMLFAYTVTTTYIIN
jgi:hypothetical protein